MKKELLVKISVKVIFLLLVTGFLVNTTHAQSGLSGTLKIAVTSSPPTIDPHFSPTAATADVAMNVFESLVGYAEDFSIRPQLANSWDISEDGKVYTFYLVPGVKFHNGRELNANDVKASLERIIEISPIKARFGAIESIEIVDELTVRLILSEPNAALLQTLAETSASILPVEAIEGKAGGQAEIIGTGPFRFIEWLPDRYVRLAPFADYIPRGAEPGGNTGLKYACVAEVQIIPVPEDSARAAGLQTGEYHIVDFLPYGTGRRLGREPGLEILEVEQHMMPFVYFNHRSDRVTANQTLRKAIQVALNHEDIMAVAAEGFGRLHPTLFFRVWETDRGLENYDVRNTALAVQLMSEAGYGGEPLVIVTNTSFDVMYRSALIVERQLQNVGFNTELQVYDWPGSISARAGGNWDLFFSGHLSLQPDPSFIEFHLQPATSPFGYNDPHVSMLFSQGRKATDFTTRYEVYSELQGYLYETAAWIKLFDQNIFQGIQSSVDGYRPWPFMRAFNVCLTD